MQRIDSSFDELIRRMPDGTCHPHVCAVCDRFLFQKDQRESISAAKLFAKKHILSWENAPTPEDCCSDIKKYYKYNFQTGGKPATNNKHFPNEATNLKWLSNLCLSPRASATKKGILCCKTCKNKLNNNQVPFHAIVNGNYTGPTPKCFQDLTETELAFLNLTKTYGCCFSYVGGTQKNLKGTLTFLRVQERKIAQTVSRLSALGLKKEMVVILSGQMTKTQKKKARDRCTFNVERLQAAVEWLCKNNKVWKKMDLEALKKEAETFVPTVVDHSDTVDDSTDPTSSNTEQTESFCCYFPDGAVDSSSGGLDNPEEFKELVQEAKKRGYNMEFHFDTEKVLVTDTDGDNFVAGSLLQFPYGVGGFDQQRKTGEDALTTKVNLATMLEHWSNVSKPEFHHQLFVLMLYNMHVRQQLFKHAKFQLKEKVNASVLANGLQTQDLDSAIWFRQSGVRSGTVASKSLLDAVQSCSKALPHTKEASQKARATAEAMNAALGIGSWFLTVTFDDDNSFLMQVISGKEIDKGLSIESLTDEQLKQMAKERTALRLNFPGLTSHHFEVLLNIVIEEAIGWDMNNGKPTTENGLFGKCRAFSIAVEEQGRKTLHAHCIIWIENHQHLMDSLQMENAAEQEAIATSEQYLDHVATTELVGELTRREEQIMFDHDGCSKNQRDRSRVQGVTKQQLRLLRWKNNRSVCGGFIVCCPHCTKAWTAEEVAELYLKRLLKLDDVSSQDGTIVQFLWRQMDQQPASSIGDVQQNWTRTSREHLKFLQQHLF